MSGQLIDDLFTDGQLSAITFDTSEASFAIPLEQILYIEKDVKRNIKVGESIEFNHEVITFQNKTVQLYDFNKLMGAESHQQNITQMLSELDEMAKQHKIWIDQLEVSLREKTAFTEAIDPTRCAFGIWYKEFQTDNEELKELLKKFDAPHKKLHGLAHELLELNKSEPEEALRKLSYEKQNTLSELLNLFQITKDSALSSIRPIIIFVEHADKRITALRLDRINDIQTFKQSQFSKDESHEGIFKNRQLDFHIEGFLREGESAPAMLINCQPYKAD